MKDWEHPRKTQIINFLSTDILDDLRRCARTAQNKDAAFGGRRESFYLKRCLQTGELLPGAAAKTIIDGLKFATLKTRQQWFEKHVARILKDQPTPPKLLPSPG